MVMNLEELLLELNVPDEDIDTHLADYQVVLEQQSTSYPAEKIRGVRWEHSDRQVVIEVE